jgi:hypothetical protein
MGMCLKKTIGTEDTLVCLSKYNSDFENLFLDKTLSNLTCWDTLYDEFIIWWNEYETFINNIVETNMSLDTFDSIQKRIQHGYNLGYTVYIKLHS